MDLWGLDGPKIKKVFAAFAEDLGSVLSTTLMVRNHPGVLTSVGTRHMVDTHAHMQVCTHKNKNLKDS